MIRKQDAFCEMIVDRMAMRSVYVCLLNVSTCAFLITGCAVKPPPSVGNFGLAGGTGVSATTASPPMTLPRFLGVESVATGFHRVVYRSRLRASTLLPILAPLPASASPVAVCDPSCLESPAPAVATAAALQLAEAAAPGKAKAMAYLATLDSCRNPQIEEAFLAAMDDPSDSVRIAAVQGVIDMNTRCGGCRTCGYGCAGCCTPAIQSKLLKLAFETNEMGCWCEHNPKVRRLARVGSCKCKTVVDPTTASIPEELPASWVLELSRTPGTP